MKTIFSPNAFLLIVLLLASSIAGLAQQGDLTAAVEAYRSGAYDKAVPLLKKAAKANDADAKVWQLLGSSYLSLRHYKDSIKAYQKAVALEPSNDAYQANLAFAYLTVRNNKASEAAGAALKLNQNNAEAHYILGVLAYREEMYVQAYDRSKRAIELSPNFAAAYRLKSQALVASFLALSGKVLPPGARGDLLVEAAADLEKSISLISNAKLTDNLKDELTALRYFANYYTLPENRLVPDVTKVEPPDPDSTPLKLISRPHPPYTDSARQRNVQGTCKLLVAFDAGGKVGPILVIKSLDDDLDRGAIAAAFAIKFNPATKNGVPRSSVKQVEYTFSIY
jgi:TonB family protein